MNGLERNVWSMHTMKLAVLAAVAAIALAMVLATPAGADPASTAKVTDFHTNALDADGNFRLVFCRDAHQVIKGDRVIETYACEFVSDTFWGEPVLPTRAMRWDYESSIGLVDDNIAGLEGPYQWFSDVEDILTEDLCWWYTNDWTTVITPSGNVNATVVYDPVLEAGPDCE